MRARHRATSLAFRSGLAARGLALIVVRNATTRDALDRQQPFNLRVPGGEETIGASGTVYDIAHLQFVQADLIRGMGGTADPAPGRRVLSQFLHDAIAENPPNPGGPEGSVAVALDGSVAALVPAQRALAWQLTDPVAVPVVRERNWLTFQPGEIRTCDGCHGVNHLNQAGEPAATNSPEALRTLLQYVEFSEIFARRFRVRRCECLVAGRAVGSRRFSSKVHPPARSLGSPTGSNGSAVVRLPPSERNTLFVLSAEGTPTVWRRASDRRRPGWTVLHGVE